MPNTVRVDPKVKFTGTEFHAPNNEFAIRWTGKLLIDSTGDYEFDVSADDAAWVAIDGRILLDLHGCGHQKTRSKSGTTKLEKGAHDISILYMNKGPKGGGHPGNCELKYKGPDTESNLIDVPTAKLGSAPLRLAKLAKEMAKSEDKDKVAQIIPGAFIYDDQNR